MGSSIWKTDHYGSGQNKRRNTIFAVFAAILIALGMFGYDYMQTYARSYSGVLVEKEKKFRWWRGKENWYGPEYRRYNHYWIVETDDGDVVRSRASRFRYNGAEIGDEVIKVRGERFPRIVEEDDSRQFWW